MIHRSGISVPARSHFIDKPVVGAVLGGCVGCRHAAIVGERLLAYQKDVETGFGISGYVLMAH